MVFKPYVKTITYHYDIIMCDDVMTSQIQQPPLKLAASQRIRRHVIAATCPYFDHSGNH